MTKGNLGISWRMNIQDIFKNKFNFSEELLEELLDGSRERSFDKGDLVLEPGTTSQDVYFIEKGLVRIFYYKELKTITHFFFMENSFVTSSESLFYNKKSIYGIEALEQSKLIQIPFSLIESMADRSMEMNKVIQQILTTALTAFSRRLNSLQFESAQERYQYLMETNPDIILRAPLGDIASYLGISQQTLSVIRAQVK